MYQSRTSGRPRGRPTTGIPESANRASANYGNQPHQSLRRPASSKRKHSPEERSRATKERIWAAVARWQKDVQLALDRSTYAGDASPEVVEACLGLIRCCSDGAFEILYGDGAPWRAPYLSGGCPSSSHVEEALKLLKLADVALESPVAKAMDCQNVSGAIPRAMTWGSLASVYYVQNRPRVALGYSEQAVEALSACCPEPTQLVKHVLKETSSRSIAERVITIISSHGTILHKLGKDSAALPFAQLGVTLSTSLADCLMLAAAGALASVRQRSKQDWVPPADLLDSRTPVGTLQAIALYNAAMITKACLLASSREANSQSLWKPRGKAQEQQPPPCHPDSISEESAKILFRLLGKAKEHADADRTSAALSQAITEAKVEVRRLVDQGQQFVRHWGGGVFLPPRHHDEGTLLHIRRTQGAIRSQRALQELKLHRRVDVGFQVGSPDVQLEARQSMVTGETWLSDLGL